MTRHLLHWRGNTYPAIELVVFPGTDAEEEVLVSTVELGHELLDEIGNYLSDEATELDETIVYYLEPDEINLPDEEIRKIIENALS